MPTFKRTTRSSSNTKYVEGQGHVTDYDAAQAMWDEGRHYVVGGVVRWRSNDSVPPLDILEDWVELGLDFDLAASVRADEADWDKFAADYRANPPQVTDEDMFEMRAAFGEGTTVVNCITGKKFQV